MQLFTKCKLSLKPFTTSCLLIACVWSYLALPSLARERIRFDEDWKFRLGEQSHGEIATSEDSQWHSVRLPHDWSIQLPTAPEATSLGGGGFFQTGIGQYQTEFPVPEHWSDQRVVLEFEGVYRDAEVWLNGVSVGKHHYGYTPFWIDLSQHLKPGEANTLEVRVDNSAQPNSRWYSGSGICRPVWLHVTNSVHVEPQQLFLKTRSLTSQRALVDLQATIVNDSNEQRDIQVRATVHDSSGHEVAVVSRDLQLDSGLSSSFSDEMTITQPQPWSPETPSLYTVQLEVIEKEQTLDEYTTTLGLRTISVSAQQGLLLNGKPVKLCGANVHHDNGPLGAAAFDRAERRKVQILKDAGFNCLRTAHNPPSTAFLKACDELGMLVVDEAFDGWAAKKTEFDYGVQFHDAWQADLEAMVRRDRNHPAVIMWSIGNEMYERSKPAAVSIAKAMVSAINELDNSRPTSAGINGLGETGDWSQLDDLFGTLEVAGYNYELSRLTEDHERLPQRVIMSTESYPQDVFATWEATAKHPYFIGDFVWSGLDYLGESGIGRVFAYDEQVVPHWEGNHFPWHGATCGDIDITGWRKPISHYRNIVWDRGEKLYVAVRVPEPHGRPWQRSKWAIPPALPSWTWPEHEGREMIVDVYSRYPRIRLYLNDRLIDEQPTTRDHEFRAEFKILHESGTLTAVGVDGGSEKQRMSLVTAGEAARIQLVPERKSIAADGQDLAYVRVEVLDSEGRLCPQSDADIEYSIEGPGTIAAIGSGDLASRESYQANPRKVFQGRGLLIVRSTGELGAIEVTAASRGLNSAMTVVKTAQ